MKDQAILRKLGTRLAEIAALPVQAEKRNLWIEHNGLRDTRPLVTIDQLPWHEIGKSEEMQLLCEDAFLRSVELTIRKLLYRWNHFPVDMVVENRIDIPVSVRGLKYGMDIVEDIIDAGDGNDIVSHKYHDELADEVALAKMQNDKIWVDRDLDQKRLDICNDIFNGIIPVRLKGVEIHNGVWDRIAQMRPADKILWDIIDKPDFTKEIVKKFVDITMNTIDQCEQLGILDADMQYVHCTGAYTDELPSKDFNAEKPMSKDVWVFGMAQIFSTVSPQMHDEFEIDLVMPLYDRFGMTYYGCCEPLENVIPYVKKIKNVRKISCSPWANTEKSAELLGKDYVFSCKPNPAFIALGQLDDVSAKKQMVDVINACKKTGTQAEMILKDVSTVSGKLSILDEWAKMTMELVQR
jgi:hypothetical protein